MDEQDLLDAVDSGESLDWEFKSARGGFPAAVWETVSAMANTEGGTIVLGVGEKDGNHFVEGLSHPEKSLKECLDSANNRGKISVNLLGANGATLVDIQGKRVLVLRIQRADRRQRPVFVGQNPYEGTYRRGHEGDYRCSREEVGRMLADQSPEPADARILPQFQLADLDTPSLEQYRQRFSSRSPQHPWLSESLQGFLHKLGGWRYNRDVGEEGLTVAALLMFGSENALNDSATGLKYHLDFRQRPTNRIADRWTDRVTLDGTWTPNLFQFYLKVYPRLTADLKLPFAYQPRQTELSSDPIRSGITPAHEGIQEALVNALIHADYRGNGGIVIDSFSDRIELSNPGTLLVSIEQLRQGGISECRNPYLQKMFQMIGAGDKAGSGVDKIRRGWESQQWRSPTVAETNKPDRVQFVLPLVSLLPPQSVSRLRQLFGADYDSLNPVEVQTLVTADLEEEVSNSRLQLFRTEHPVELTRMLQSLTQRGFLEQIGQKRAAVYRLPQWLESTPPLAPGTPPLAPGTPPLAPGTPPLALGTPPLANSELLEISRPAREKLKLAPELTRRIIQQLCAGRYLTSQELADLMARGRDKLREKFIGPMVDAGELQLRYPNEPNHPDQAYTATHGILSTPLSELPSHPVQ